HKAESVDIHGTTTFASDESKSQGTFTAYYGLRYALIGFSGVANEHSAEISRMSDGDYNLLLKALWHGVRSSANTRSKVGQIPHLLISIEYKKGEEFQFGRLHDYVRLETTTGKEEKEWSSPEDFQVDLSKLLERIGEQKERIDRICYAQSPDLYLKEKMPEEWQLLGIEKLNKIKGVESK
ncbi:MAG: type I CRISPR-associated protein Cas7, partial [Dethiobacteria bacterium]